MTRYDHLREAFRDLCAMLAHWARDVVSQLCEVKR